MDTTNQLFQSIITSNSTQPEAITWLEEQINETRGNFNPNDFFMRFSAVPRFFGHHGFSITEHQLQAIASLEMQPAVQRWNLSQLVRVFLLLQIPTKEKEIFVETLLKLWDTADMEEAVALYTALPMLPFPEAFIQQSIEGLRTNIVSVFDAIALHNSYPEKYLPDAAWNQLYLKAAFMGRRIHHIRGASQRANADLARTISDFAHERWAAGRTVPPDMWIATPQFLNKTLLHDIKKLFKSNKKLERVTAILICQESNSSEAKKILSELGNIAEISESKETSWETISNKWYEMHQTV